MIQQIKYFYVSDNIRWKHYVFGLCRPVRAVTNFVWRGTAVFIWEFWERSKWDTWQCRTWYWRTKLHGWNMQDLTINGRPNLHGLTMKDLCLWRNGDRILCCYWEGSRRSVRA